MPIQGSLQDIASKRKEVYKPILDNPFTKSSEWPVMAPNVADHVMDCLSQLLSRYGRHLEMTQGMKTHDAKTHDAKTHDAKTHDAKKHDEKKHDEKKHDAKKHNSAKAPVPEEAKYIHLGFNSVVQVLEKQAGPNRARVLKRKSTALPADWCYVKYVFVTKADISTGLLTDLFPTLTFSASRSGAERVKLVELPKGASARLSKVLHSDHVNFLALSSDWTSAKFLFDYIDEHIEDVRMPWLEGIFDGSVSLDPVYQRPNIKYVKTSAPMGGREGKGNRKGKTNKGMEKEKNKGMEKEKNKGMEKGKEKTNMGTSKEKNKGMEKGNGMNKGNEEKIITVCKDQPKSKKPRIDATNL